MKPRQDATLGRPETISVITICRDAETLIEATMISVLEQTYAPIEYIIVDGLSSDHTLEVARQTAGRFPQRSVSIISEADQGISDAMNKGVLAASGALVAHLHAGDRYIDKTVIEKVMASFKNDSWRWGVAESIVVDIGGQPQHVYHPRSDFRRLLKQNFIPHQSTFLGRDIFERHGLFRVDLKQAMDYEYWLRLAFNGGERYRVLPFATTYSLEGGHSSRLGELLRYLAVVRRELRVWVPELTWLDDALFLSRVVAFSVYSALKWRFEPSRERSRFTPANICHR